MKALLTSLLLITVVSLQAQNLIPNPSFEVTDCPTAWSTNGNMGIADWYSANLGSPDYYGPTFNGPCYTTLDIPEWQDLGEFQDPQDGDYMVGLFHYIDPTCIREYVSCKLIEPLQAGEIYECSMYVFRRDILNAGTDCIGMYFSQDSLSDYIGTCDFGVTGQFMQDQGVIQESTDWVHLTGQFMAEGGEEYMLLGNVFTNEQCIIESPDPDELFLSAYYYIDNVSVVPHNVTSIVDETLSTAVFPNPAETELRLEGVRRNTEYYISDHQGRLIESGTMTSNTLDIRNLGTGFYFLSLIQGDHREDHTFIKK